MDFYALLAFALIAGAGAHPSFHADFDPQPYVSGGEVPPFQSYHVHVHYVKDGQLSNMSAALLREAYIQHFNLTDKDLCRGLFEQGRMCIYAWTLRDGGIFVSGNWAAYIPLENYQEVVAWVTQHRKDGPMALDVLFHPNTNEYVHDHMRWSTWAGKPWPLNAEAFSDFGKHTDLHEYCDHWECQSMPMIGQGQGWHV